VLQRELLGRRLVADPQPEGDAVGVDPLDGGEHLCQSPAVADVVVHLIRIARARPVHDEAADPGGRRLANVLLDHSRVVLAVPLVRDIEQLVALVVGHRFASRGIE
jgi:hypothetical protein